MEQYLVPMQVVSALPFTTSDDSRTQIYRAGRDVLLKDGSVVTIAGFRQRGKVSFITTWRWRGEADILPPDTVVDDDEYRLIWTAQIEGVLLDATQLNGYEAILSEHYASFQKLPDGQGHYTSYQKLPADSPATQGGNWWQAEARQARPVPQKKIEPEPEETPPMRTIPTLVDWLSQKHQVKRSGSDSYYVRDDGTRILWAGITARWAVIVKQHHALVRGALRWRDTEPVDIPNEVFVEYPDLAEYGGIVIENPDLLPAWAQLKTSFVGLSKSGRMHRSHAHRHIVSDALGRGYDVPPQVLENYPDLAKKYGIVLEDEPDLPPTADTPPAPAPAPDKPSEVIEVFERWELHLLTGAVSGRRKSAFNRALSAIEDAAVLDYALSQIPATDSKRRTAIEKRINKISEK